MRRRSLAAGAVCGVIDDEDCDMDDYNYTPDAPFEGDSEDEDIAPMSEDEDY